MKRLVLWLVMVIALLSQAAPGSELAMAQDSDQAREAEFKAVVKKAFGFYGDKDYEQAIKTFVEARLIIDDPDLLYNIALCYQKMEDCLESKKQYANFMKRKDPNHELYKKAAAASEALGECPTTGTLQVTCTPQAGGTVIVDENPPVACSDLAGLKFKDLSPGKHTVLVAAPGHESEVVEVEIKAGKFKAESINLKLTEGSKIGPVVEDDEINWLGWGLTGGGIVLIGAAVGVDIANLSNQEELEKLPVGADDRAAVEDSYNTNQIVILTLGSIGVVALVTGVTFLITGVGKPDPESKERPGNAWGDDDTEYSWQFVPSVGQEQVGGVFQLSF